MTTVMEARPGEPQLTLWGPVENPGGDKRERGRRPPDRSLFLSTLIDALIAAFDIQAARVDALEAALERHLEESKTPPPPDDVPMSRDALVERLRALRDQIALD